MEKLIQICMIIYQYNFDAEKKNWQILFHRMGDGSSQLTETYMYSWLRNLVGLTGAFQLALYPKPPSLDSEYLNVIAGGKMPNLKIKEMENIEKVK